MASPGELVQLMADILGTSKASVVQYDRTLSEHGLRSRGGRGTSAARVNSRDAANLLIGLAASSVFGLLAKDAARTCKIYGSLSEAPQRSSGKFSSLGLPILDNLPEGHCFAEALSALIDAAGKGDVFTLPKSERGPQATNSLFEVRFLGPEPAAEILASSSRGSLATRTYLSNRKRTRARGTPIIFGDLRQISSVSFSIIRALGSLIWGGSAWQEEVDARHFWPADALPGRAKAQRSRCKSS